MKNCKGITMMSLIVYVGVFLVVIGVIASISSFFYRNVTTIDSETTSDYEYNKLNLYLLEEVKKKGNSIVSVRNTDSDKYVEFSSGSKFQFQSNKIYFIEKAKNTKIMLCDNVEYLKFEKREENQKNILHMDLTLTSMEETKKDGEGNIIPTYSTDYVMDYSN